jgi:hypothetical protein
MTSETIYACAKLQLKIESSEYAMFPLRQDLLHARKSLQLAKLNWITSGKADEAEKAVYEMKAMILQLQAIKERCEEIIQCNDNCVEMMEMEFPGIANHSRERYEQLILEANRPIEKIVEELMAAPGVADVLRNGGETLEGYRYPNTFAHPALEEHWH